MALAILMPQFDDEATPGRVLAWLAPLGGAVDEGRPVVRVEHEKAVLELDAQTDGVLREIVVRAGEAARPHTILGVLAQPDEDLAPLLARAREERAAAPPARGVNGRSRQH